MKKGFTLIELLAVIVILAIIAIIATPIVLNIINDTKESAVLRSADFYLDSLENQIALENLKLGGSLIPRECIVDLNGNAVCDGALLEIEIDGEKPTGGNIIFDDGKITDVTLTFGTNIIETNKNGELVFVESQNQEQEEEQKIECTLISGKDKTVGAKYQCKVKDQMEQEFKDGYYFYVLSKNESGTINLIMDRNICEDGTLAKDSSCSYQWISQSDYDEEYAKADDDTVYQIEDYESYYNYFGPVTARKKLYAATSTWNNKLKLRLPYEDEIFDAGCDNENESCPTWLVEYLDHSGYEKYADIEKISGITGYWTSSAYEQASAGNIDDAWYVGSSGIVWFTRASSDFGIRPVITLEI